VRDETRVDLGETLGILVLAVVMVPFAPIIGSMLVAAAAYLLGLLVRYVVVPGLCIGFGAWFLANLLRELVNSLGSAGSPRRVRPPVRSGRITSTATTFDEHQRHASELDELRRRVVELDIGCRKIEQEREQILERLRHLEQVRGSGTAFVGENRT
jgi:hypothetical protein